MNERIRELINEATSFKEGLIEEKYDIEVFDKEKFAELIVQNCADIIESQDVDPSFKLRMSWAVKKHFGVK